MGGNGSGGSVEHPAAAGLGDGGGDDDAADDAVPRRYAFDIEGLLRLLGNMHAMMDGLPCANIASSLGLQLGSSTRTSASASSSSRLLLLLQAVCSACLPSARRSCHMLAAAGVLPGSGTGSAAAPPAAIAR